MSLQYEPASEQAQKAFCSCHSSIVPGSAGSTRFVQFRFGCSHAFWKAFTDGTAHSTAPSEGLHGLRPFEGHPRVGWVVLGAVCQSLRGKKCRGIPHSSTVVGVASANLISKHSQSINPVQGNLLHKTISMSDIKLNVV